MRRTSTNVVTSDSVYNLSNDLKIFVLCCKMSYEDTPKLSEHAKRLLTCKNIGEIIELCKEIYPMFIKSYAKGYCIDYPQFDLNWRAVCASLKTRKVDIMLVDNFEEDDSHVLPKMFCEIFTQAGFNVRPFSDYIKCNVCACLIPTEHFYNNIKSKGASVPANWNNKCSTC